MSTIHLKMLGGHLEKSVRGRLCFEILSDFSYLVFLKRIFKGYHMPESSILNQILVEAFNNAVVHAHHHQKKQWIAIDLKWGKKKVCIRVIDKGPGLPRKGSSHQPQKWKTHGRGFALMNALADKVLSYRRQGKHILEVWKSCA